MHAAMLVVGPEPAERARKAGVPLGPVEWAGIGGRFQGSLITIPGARSGVLYGDTMPAFEAQVLGMAMPEGVTAIRAGADAGPGVDQAQRSDVDVPMTLDHALPQYVLAADGTVLDAGFTPEEGAAGFMESIPEQFLSPQADAIIEGSRASRAAKSMAWLSTVAGLLESVPAGELVTIVDIHF
jgi:hypothetical protein